MFWSHVSGAYDMDAFSSLGYLSIPDTRFHLLYACLIGKKLHLIYCKHDPTKVMCHLKTIPSVYTKTQSQQTPCHKIMLDT